MVSARRAARGHAKFSGALHCVIRRWREIERWIENEAGGTIRFTDYKCPIKGKFAKNWRLAYSTANNGSVVDACWIFDNDTNEMVTVYSDGTLRRYPAKSATPTEYMLKQMEKKGGNI